MKLKAPNNFTQLSICAFTFANRQKKWTYNDPIFEGVSIHEYWTKDLTRNGEDRVRYFEGDKASFDNFFHFIASITVLEFGDEFFTHEHSAELEKWSINNVDVSSFYEIWQEHASIVVDNSITKPKNISKAYSTSADWNYVTLFGENKGSYHGMIWETTA